MSAFGSSRAGVYIAPAPAERGSNRVKPVAEKPKKAATEKPVAEKPKKPAGKGKS